MFLTALASVRETIFGATFASEVVGISQQGPAAVYASLELFLKEDVTYELFVVGGRIINFGYDALAEDGGDVVRSIGLAPFLVYLGGDVSVSYFLQFQVQNLSLNFSQISPLNIKIESLHQVR